METVTIVTLGSYYNGIDLSELLIVNRYLRADYYGLIRHLVRITRCQIGMQDRVESSKELIHIFIYSFR